MREGRKERLRAKRSRQESAAGYREAEYDPQRAKRSQKARKEAAQGKRARNKEFARVTYVFVALFLVLLGYIGYFQVKKARRSSEVLIMPDRIRMQRG